MIKFSLILCTLNRVDCLYVFFENLDINYRDFFEIIIVDQNADDILKPIITKYKDIYNIVHLKSSPGLSKSRNIGINYAKGEILCFPDDDCYFSKELLKKVFVFFQRKDISLLSIKMTNSIVDGRKIQTDTKNCYIKKENVFNLCASISLFVKKEVAIAVGGFDEQLGLGSSTNFKSCEDYDFPLKILSYGYLCYYTKDVEVFHPWDDKNFKLTESVKFNSFWAGATEMYLLNKYSFSNLFKIKWIIRRVLIIIFFTFNNQKSKVIQSSYILKGMLTHLSTTSIDK